MLLHGNLRNGYANFSGTEVSRRRAGDRLQRRREGWPRKTWAVAVVRGGCLIVNLPGSPRGVRENLGAVLEALGHAVELLRGAVRCRTALDRRIDERSRPGYHMARRLGTANWREPKKGGHGLQLKPMGDKVIVRVLEQEEKTAGGIVLPDTAKEKPQQGEVLAVGKGRISDKGKLLPPEVAVGDRVVFARYVGSEVKEQGEKYLILEGRDLLAVL